MKHRILLTIIICMTTSMLCHADILVVPVRKVIDGGLAEFVRRVIEEAEQEGVEGIIFHVDTPGGRVDSAVDIKDTILKTGIPTTAFVDKNAISAGSLISLACDSIYMSTGGSIGAATAVDLQGQKASEKVISYFRAQMRATAEANGRRADVAEAMVDDEIEIESVTEEGKLLTLTYNEAIELGISDGTADTLDDVLRLLGKDGSKLRHVNPNWAENIVRFLTHPVVSSLLMSVGFLGLLIELRTPGWGVAGTAGLIAIMLFFGSHYIVRLAGVGELILFAAGIILLTLEVMVIPGFGVAGIAGISLIVVSLYLSLVGRLPHYGDYRIAAVTVMGSFVLTVMGAVAAVKLLPHSSFYRKLVLHAVEEAGEGYLSAETDHGILGASGVALTDLRPSGKAEIDGRRLDVVTEGEFVIHGSNIIVTEVRGSRIVVRETTIS